MGSNQSTVGYTGLRHPSTDSPKKFLLRIDDCERQKLERGQVEKGQNLDKNAPLHKEVKESKSCSTPETNSRSPDSKSMISHPHQGQKTEVNPQKEVNLLRLRIATLEKRVIKQEEVSEIMKKIAALEKSVLKLTSTINEIKQSTEPEIRDPIPNLIDFDPVPVTVEPNNSVIVAVTGQEFKAKNCASENMWVMPDREFQATDPDNELAGCLVVIIFLLGILIGNFCF